jgi:hypothetical protein
MQCAWIHPMNLNDPNVKAEEVRFVLRSTSSGEEVVFICLWIVGKHVVVGGLRKCIGRGERPAWIRAITSMVVGRTFEASFTAIQLRASWALNARGRCKVVLASATCLHWCLGTHVCSSHEERIARSDHNYLPIVDT